MAKMPSKPTRIPSVHSTLDPLLSSKLDSLLRKQKIGHAPVSYEFGGTIYSDDDRQAITKTLVQAAGKSIPSQEQLENALSEIEDRGTEYLARKNVLPSWPPPHVLRKQLEQLIDAVAEERFRKVASDLHPSLWIRIALKAEGLPPLVEKELYRPVTENSQPKIGVLLSYAQNIRKAARHALDSLKQLKSKRGSRQNILTAWFAWTLIPVVEAVTPKKARASYVLNYKCDDFQRWQGRSRPFVDFVAACLKPIDSDAVSPQLGEIIYSHIFRNRKILK